jgi:hypothetical protein
MAENFDFKVMADEVSKALTAGHSDLDIDRALFNAYPDLTVDKSNFTPHGEYIPGSAYRAFFQGMARKIRPRGDMKYFKNLGREWVHGGTLGGSNHLGALLLSATNDDITYKQALKNIDEEQANFRELYPGDAMGAEVGGALTSPVTYGIAAGTKSLLSTIPWLEKLLAPVAGQTVKNVFRETAIAVPTGVTESVGYTAGTSRSPEEFLQRVPLEAGITGVGSAVLTPPMIAATAGAKRGVNRLIGPGKPPPPSGGGETGIPAGRPDDERGLGIIAQQQEETGVTSEMVEAELQRLRGVDPALEEVATTMDVGGSQMVPTTQGALMYAGQARNIGEKNLAPFLENQVNRLKAFTAKTLLKAPSVDTFVKELKNRKRVAGKLYDSIFKRKERVSPDFKTTIEVDGQPTEISLAAILDESRPSVQDALKAAKTLAAERRTILPQPNQAGYDGEFLHFIKMGYDQVLTSYGEGGLKGTMRGDAIQNLKALIKVLDKKLPGYQSARKQYAEPVAQNRAFNDGFLDMKRTTTSPETVPEMLAFKVSELSGAEKKAYQAGAARFLEDFISRDMDALSLTNKSRQLSKEGMVNKVRSIFGKDAATKYKSYMTESAKMFQRRALVMPDVGSQTAPRQEAQKLYKMGQREATSAIPLSRGAMLEAVSSAGAQSKMRELESRAASANAARLTQTGPKAIRKNQEDVERFRRSVLFQQALDNMRRGSIPGLLAPTSESIQHYGSQIMR